MTAYYNEFDPFAAAWLRELMADGLIAEGEVDERSILDVRPEDLRGFTQCHFFAGIGGWPYALRLAGWPDDRPVWTGSCPCQPLSSAGKQKGHDDERHLWPAFYELIAECRPSAVYGEQVASKLGREWLAGVRADLEDARYAVGAADLCAAGVGAPHIRQRLFWVAHSQRGASERHGHEMARTASSYQGREKERQRLRDDAGDGFATGNGLADTTSPRQAGAKNAGTDRSDAGEGPRGVEPQRSGADGGLAHAEREGERGGRILGPGESNSAVHGPAPEQRPDGSGAPSDGVADTNENRQCSDSGARRSGRSPQTGHHAWWRGILISCADGKSRRVPADETGQPQPSVFPLAHGVPNRVGTLRGAGNAIVPQVAAAFVRATSIWVGQSSET